MSQDWYCDELLSGRAQVDVLIDTPTVLAFRPPRAGYATEHIVVIPKQHVLSLLELEPDLAVELFAVLRQVSTSTVERHGGCRVFTNVGTEQHVPHLHWHVAAGAATSP